MIKVLINGCNGRMGQELVKQIDKTEGIEVIAGVDKNTALNNSFPVYDNIWDNQEKPDAIIDFSIVPSTLAMLDYAKENKIPTVVATTGFNEEEKEKIKEISKEIPIFQSSNMSYEVNMMSKLVAELAKKLPDADIEIIETHHNRKIDSPSGTALILADAINKARNDEMYYEYNRHSKKEKRNKKEIGIHSIRGGNEVGKHTVIYFGENESFEITHNVLSRGVFAEGAVKACLFLVNQKPGFYNMDNLT